MADPDPQATARRNLVRRIDRLVDRILRQGFQPDRDALENLTVALESLEAGNCPVGEDAMMLAEKGFAPRSPRVAAPGPIHDLMERFARLSQER